MSFFENPRAVWTSSALVAVATFGALQIPAAHDPTIEILLLAVPASTLLAAAATVRSASRTTTRVALAITAVALVSALALEGAAFLRHPMATATLTRSHPDATLSLPRESHDLLVQARAALRGSNARGSYGVDLERDGNKAAVRGTLERHAPNRIKVGRKRMRTSDHGGNASELHPLTLAGEGPVHAHLAFTNGSIPPAIHLAVLKVPAWTHWIGLGLVVLAVLSLGVQVAATREGLKTRFASGIALAAAVALHVDRTFDADSTTRSAVWAAMAGVVAALLAAGVAWLALRFFGSGEAASSS